MVNRFSKTIWLVVMPFFIIAGCEQQQQQRPQKEDLSSQIPAYISAVVEKAGGLEAWNRTSKLELDCVVTFYQPDGSFHLTEQRHEIYPSLNLILISAQETQGKFIWEFSPTGLRVIEGTKRMSFLPIGLGAGDFAEAILNITTTPVQLLKYKAGLMRGSRPVKVEGRWYYPIERVGDNRTNSEQYGPKCVFYQNTDSSLVEMIWFANIERGTFLAVRGYYYHEVEKSGVAIPTKIEIFKTDARLVIRHRLAKIDYY